MQIHRSHLMKDVDAPAGCAVTIGNFDGVHRGHRELLAHAVRDALASGLTPTLLTFDPHPAQVLGREPPALLTPLVRKVELAQRKAIVERRRRRRRRRGDRARSRQRLQQAESRVTASTLGRYVERAELLMFACKCPRPSPIREAARVV